MIDHDTVSRDIKAVIARRYRWTDFAVEYSWDWDEFVAKSSTGKVLARVSRKSAIQHADNLEFAVRVSLECVFPGCSFVGDTRNRVAVRTSGSRCQVFVLCEQHPEFVWSDEHERTFLESARERGLVIDG